MTAAELVQSGALGVAVSLFLVASAPSSARAAPLAAPQVCGDWVQVAPPMGATKAVTDVQAVSANDAWAFAIPLGLVRWDGSSWDQFPIDDPVGPYSAIYIQEFGLVGSSHLFLAGTGSTSPFSSDQVLKVWDGTSWSDWHTLTLQTNAAGAPRNGSPAAVAGAAIDDVWIVGNASGMGTGVGGSPVLTVHWDGSQLTEFLTPGIGDRQNNLNAAVAIAPDDVWAVGNYENWHNSPLYFHGATYHWDGSSWSVIPNPTDATSFTQVGLTAVTAIASDDVWAAGYDGNKPLFMHWDGTDWEIVPAPATTGSIYGLAAIATDDVWAVDAAAQAPSISKYYHWNGAAWSIVTPPSIPGATSISRHGGLAEVGACDVWAVGSIEHGSGLGPFIERLEASNAGGASSYCVAGANSAGAGARLSSVGSVSVAASTFTLVANGAPPVVNGLFFYGPSKVQVPFGHGFLCVSGTIQRLPADTTNAAGHVQRTLDFTLPPVGSGPNAILPGSTWNFQLWYRDPAARGSGFNLSNGLSVQFLP